jgi:hypothetical protein
MRALVVHESLYGNTRRVAEEVTAGLAASGDDLEVRCRPAADVVAEGPGALGWLDLLVLGCPTHAWRMSSTRSRTAQLAKDAAEVVSGDGPRAHDPDATGPGLRELLALGLDAGQPVAAFDTRMDSRFSGGAAPRIARAARRAGGAVFGEPTGFVVTGTTGPLRDGETGRARAWGAELGAMLAATRRVH